MLRGGCSITRNGAYGSDKIRMHRFSEYAGRHAGVFPEQIDEVIDIFKATAGADLLDLQIGCEQQILRLLNPAPVEVLQRRNAIGGGVLAAEPVAADMELLFKVICF